MKSTVPLSPILSLPVDLAGRRTAVFGISGAGKSNTATVLMEGLLDAGEQVVGIDPKGEMWGLLSLANGKPSNLPLIVFGEPNGHIDSLSEGHGPKLADFVVETGRSVVLSLLGFESDQSERRFVAAFLRQLYRRKSRQPHATRTLVVLDEAHLFVPENVRGDGAELSGAVQKIVRQGRSFGIGTLLVDQRPQDVAKRVISQCDTLICHQLVHKTDRDALRDWVRGYDREGRGEQFLESLAALEPGEAWVWSPAWLKLFQRAKVRRRRTFDSGAAPDGTAAAKTVQRANVNLDELRGQLAEVVEKAKADDPKELRKRILELEKQLREKPPAPATTKEVEKRVEVPVLKNGQLERTEKILDRLEKIVAEIHSDGAELRRVIAPACRAKLEIARSGSVPPARPTTSTIVAPQTSKSPHTEGPKPLGKSGKRRMLIALAQNPDGLTHTKLSILTGISQGGGTWRTYLSELRGEGFVENMSDGRLRITAEGEAAIGNYKPLPTGDALIEYWRQRLGGSGKRRIFDVVVQHYPRAVPQEEVAAACSIEIGGGTWRTYLSELRGMELVEGRGDLKASDDLFG
jgi:hypothetical protein